MFMNCIRSEEFVEATEIVVCNPIDFLRMEEMKL